MCICSLAAAQQHYGQTLGQWWSNHGPMMIDDGLVAIVVCGDTRNDLA